MDNSKKYKILLVEDDESLSNVYVTRFEAEGFDIRRVGNGEDALATAINYQPDIILLDIMMPKVDGFDVLDILKNTNKTKDLKIIMLSALSQEMDIDKAKKLGADDYLIKSEVTIADVVEKIKKELN
ncbi:MAG: response regulator [bacterium]|jgi:DNA-binding response OmpR family regulator